MYVHVYIRMYTASHHAPDEGVLTYLCTYVCTCTCIVQTLMHAPPSLTRAHTITPHVQRPTHTRHICSQPLVLWCRPQCWRAPWAGQPWGRCCGRSWWSRTTGAAPCPGTHGSAAHASHLPPHPRGSGRNLHRGGWGSRIRMYAVHIENKLLKVYVCMYTHTSPHSITHLTKHTYKHNGMGVPHMHTFTYIRR